MTSTYSTGFVYVLTNTWMPDIVKIGFTSLLPEDRAKVLYTTGVPAPFDIAYRAMTSSFEAVEKEVHDLLKDCRVNAGREFFRTSPDEAARVVQSAARKITGISRWPYSAPLQIRAGDRLALRLEEGQAFALLSYRDMFSRNAEIVDLWQAHSSGDLLEIYGVDTGTVVAGFSNGDRGAETDPLPHLDRKRSVANGYINGRERLMRGDRLVWLPSPSGPTDRESVIFEACDHCQIISRTWTLKFIDGVFPLALNVFTHEAVWPAAQRAIDRALALPIPRTWAPRDNRAPEWQLIGSEDTTPDHWLPQLKPKTRKPRKPRLKSTRDRDISP
jgi:hypothetical protein